MTRRADTLNMTRSGKTHRPAGGNLKNWADRDDRPWLAELGREHWSEPYCLKSLHSILIPIVTSLSFASHSRWGMQPSKDELVRLEAEFHSWMQKLNGWELLQRQWTLDHKGPWSLPLTLSRHYGRFLKSAPAHSIRRATSPDADLLRESSLGFDPAPIFLAAFDEILHDIPDPISRLCYQLHLDGLISSEISALLGETNARVEERLSATQMHVEQLFQEKAYGT